MVGPATEKETASGATPDVTAPAGGVMVSAGMPTSGRKNQDTLVGWLLKNATSWLAFF